MASVGALRTFDAPAPLTLGVRSMKTVYHLQYDIETIASMQSASLGSGPTGLRITHGLVGSKEWWSNIESGTLPLQTLRGEVSGFWPGQWGDGPAEFELKTAYGERSMWLCEMPPSRAKALFIIGRAVEVSFVKQVRKTAVEGIGDESKITVSISLD